MSTEVEAPRPAGRPSPRRQRRPRKKSPYPYWFYLPAAVIFFVFFAVPTFSSFFFSLTRWDLSTWEFIGLDNYVAFFEESALITGLRNTLVYAVVTCSLKVVLGMLLARCSPPRSWPGAAAIGGLLPGPGQHHRRRSHLPGPHGPSGLINDGLALVGINGPAWLVDPKTALLSVALVDVWKGVGLATVIFIAGIVSIPVSTSRRPRRMAPQRAAVLEDHPAAVPTRDHDRDHPGADRRPAVLRPHLGDDPGPASPPT